MLSDLTDDMSLAPPDRARARALAALTLRRLGQIDALIDSRLAKPPPAKAAIVRRILQVLTAEIVFDDTAGYAAVDSAVRLAKSDKRAERFAGLINAIGRRIAEDGVAEAAAQDASSLNTPDWLRTRLEKAWGDGAARAMAGAHQAAAPLDLTVREDAAGWARRMEASVTPTGSVRAPALSQISTAPGYAEGGWWVQDAAAAIPARLLVDVEGKRVLDLCAAPGGKTLQLAATGADVTALDISGNRMKRVAENLDRMSLLASCVTADALEWTPDAAFDAILLDAPCSASGTIRRHPDLPYLPGRDNLSRLVRLQDRLLDRAWTWLAPGGTLVYCTCSLFPEEGEERAAAFMARTPDAKAAPITAGEVGLTPEMLTAEGNLRTRPDFWPEIGGLDGFFAFRVIRGT